MSPRGLAGGLDPFASRGTGGRPGAAPAPTAMASRPYSASMVAVLAALQAGERMTGADLRLACGLPRRTVYEALRRLRERGVLSQRASLRDSRQTYFWLVEATAPGTSGAPPADARALGAGAHESSGPAVLAP